MKINPLELQTELLGEIGKHATIWEFELRVLCQNLGVEAYRVIEKDNKEKLHSNKLSVVLSNLYKKTPYLGFDFSYAKDIRDAVLHSNFLEFTDIIHDGSKERFYTPVVGGSLTKGESLINLNKDLEKGELKKAGIMGLFLRSLNRKTATEAIQILKNAQMAIKDMQTLRAYSFEFNYYEKLFIKGELFTENDYERYFKFRDFELNSIEEAKITLEKNYHYTNIEFEDCACCNP